MAYEKTNWKARKGINLNKFDKSLESKASVMLNNNPNRVDIPGTPFSVDNMNKIEQGIYDAHELITAEEQARIRGDDAKQDKITATGATNLLTAPSSQGGQPGAKAASDFLQSPAAQTANTQLLVAPPSKGAAPSLKAISDLAPANTTLAAPTSDSAAPAAVSTATAVTGILQTIWNKLLYLFNNKAQTGNGTVAGADSFLTQVQVNASSAPTNTARTLGATNTPAITPAAANITTGFGTASIAARTLQTWLQEIAGKINGLFSMRGAASGLASLDASKKILLSELPDAILGQLVYGGNFAPATGVVASLSPNAQSKLGTSSASITLTNNTTAITGHAANLGIYYIATANGTFAGISFEIGDWLISTGAKWEKVDNTDAVTGVKGDSESTYRLGNVNITKANIGLTNVDDVKQAANTQASLAAGSGTDTSTPIQNNPTVWGMIQNIWNRIFALNTNVNGKVTANTAITGATKAKITYDSKGLVTTGADLAASDIPNLPASKITQVTVADPVASDTQIAAGTFSLQSVIQTIVGNIKKLFEAVNALSSNTGNGGAHTQVIDAVCDTAAATAAKAVTISGYALASGDILAVTYTNGNTADSATINVNNAGAKQVRLGGGQPTGASGTGGHYVAAGNTVLYYYNGTYMCQFGSTDITDANTSSITNLFGAITNQHKVNSQSAGGSQAYFPLVGLYEDGTIDKITATSNSTATGARTFTARKISMLRNILYASAATTAWTAGAAFAVQLFSRADIGATNWKYAIGQYYNKAGVLTGNGTTTDLVQTPLYLGGARDGGYFTPNEFSLTLRDTSKVYKLIGYFTSAGNFYLSDYQPVYVREGNAWVTLEERSVMAADHLAFTNVLIINNETKQINLSDLLGNIIGALLYIEIGTTTPGNILWSQIFVFGTSVTGPSIFKEKRVEGHLGGDSHNNDSLILAQTGNVKMYYAGLNIYPTDGGTCICVISPISNTQFGVQITNHSPYPLMLRLKKLGV